MIITNTLRTIVDSVAGENEPLPRATFAHIHTLTHRVQIHTYSPHNPVQLVEISTHNTNLQVPHIMERIDRITLITTTLSGARLG